MQYLLLFLEGIITFISPCLLPMLPVYLSYLAGGVGQEQKRHRTLINSFGFVFGFSVVFVLMGAAAGSIGKLLRTHMQLFNIIGGLVLILFGLVYMDVIKLKIFGAGSKKINPIKGFWSASVFGAVFSIGWTPCVGTFLGSALMLAAGTQTALQGMLMLIVYSLGLGIPFILSAVLLEQLEGVFIFIKKHYRIINTAAGILLVIMGLLMMTGLLSKILFSLAG